MLKLRKRHAPSMTTDARTGDLEIRNLLDDPQLRSLMGDAAGTRSSRRFASNGLVRSRWFAPGWVAG